MREPASMCLAALAAAACTDRGGALPGPNSFGPRGDADAMDRSVWAALDHPALAVGAPEGAPAVMRPAFDAARGAFVLGERAGSWPYQLRIDARSGEIRIRRAGVAAGIRVSPSAGVRPSGPAFERAGAILFPAATDGTPAADRRRAALAIVETARQDGVHEDLVLATPVGDRLDVAWTLELDEGLEARLEAPGDVNIYGPSGPLLADAQVGDAATAKRLALARHIARKDRLLYRIPAPVVRDAAGRRARDLARFELRGSLLQLHAAGLSRLTYPIAIDPTVLVTTASELGLGGNLESGVDIDVGGNRIRRTRTRVGVAAWSSTVAFPTPRNGHAAVAYNGYLYIVGGHDGAVPLNDVQVAPINPNGRVGAWTATTAFPTPRTNLASVAYDGFLYVIGGNIFGTCLADVQVAPIRADGMLGTWVSASGSLSARWGHAAVAQGGFLYVLGGDTCGAVDNAVLAAPIRADGTLGTWTTNTGFPTPSVGHAAVAAAGNLYVIGGTVTSAVDVVRVAPVNPDGSVGTWRVTTALPGARTLAAGVAYAGHVYLLGGQSPAGLFADVLVAPVHPGGNLGAWTATRPFATARSESAAVAYDGHLYLAGGRIGATSVADVQYAPIDAEGEVRTWASGTPFVSRRTGQATVAFNGYLYVIGGRSALGSFNDVQYAPIKPDGTLGTWITATSPFSTARYDHASVAHDGYLYVIGGLGTAGLLGDVQVAPLRSDGSVGPWSFTSVLTARAGHAAVVSHGSLYVLGGNSGGSPLATVQRAPINSNGTLGAWIAQTGFSGGRDQHAAAAYAGFLYVVGGTNIATNFGDIQVAPLDPTGTVGPWTTTTTGLPTPRYAHTVSTYHGFLYVAGGLSSGAGLDEVRVAPIRADGSLGAFAVSPPLGLSRYEHSAAAWAGHLYLLGGQSSGATRDDVVIGPLNARGLAGPWTAATPFTTGRFNHAGAAASVYLYVLGGLATGVAYLSDVQVARIGADGTVGSWAATTPLPTARAYHAAAATRSHLYVSGGYDTANLSEVRVAPINPNGTVGAWALTSPLRTARCYHASVAWNRHLYVLGGIGPLNEVLVADINADGTLGPFQVTSPFQNGRYYHASVAHGGYLYVLGGTDGSTTTFGDVQVAPVNASGTLGAWVPTTALPARRQLHAAVASSGYLYVIAGSAAGVASPDILVAPINANGTLGNWTSTNPLPAGRIRPVSVTAGGFLYAMGGLVIAGTQVNDVLVAPLLAPLARGAYSKRVDLGAAVDSLDSVTINGSAASRGAVSLEYRVAPASGVYGAATRVGPVPIGAPVALGDANVQYVRLRLALDDTAAAAINLDATNERDVTDLALAYALAGADAGIADAGPVDAGAADAGAVDGGAVDAGPNDAGGMDAGAPDAAAPDGAVDDAGIDAGADAAVADAGPDGGEADDAGSDDAGGDDGGPPDAAGAPVPLYGWSCGCAGPGGGGGVASLASVAFAARATRRRRRPER